MREVIEANPNRSLYVLELTAHHERGKQPRMNDAGLSAAVKFEQLELPTLPVSVRGFFVLCLYVLWLCVLTAHHERGKQPRMNAAGSSLNNWSCPLYR